jgi:hypothetical protein
LFEFEPVCFSWGTSLEYFDWGDESLPRINHFLWDGDLLRLAITRAEADRFAERCGVTISGSKSPETDPSDWEVDPQIIETLRTIGHRLTTKALLAEMSKRGLDPSGSTVKKRLAKLADDGRLTKDPKARPRGYGLPEWHGSSSS